MVHFSFWDGLVCQLGAGASKGAALEARRDPTSGHKTIQDYSLYTKADIIHASRRRGAWIYCGAGLLRQSRGLDCAGLGLFSIRYGLPLASRWLGQWL